MGGVSLSETFRGKKRPFSLVTSLNLAVVVEKNIFLFNDDDATYAADGTNNDMLDLLKQERAALVPTNVALFKNDMVLEKGTPAAELVRFL